MAKQTFTTGQVLTAAQMTSLQQTAMGGGSPSTKTASYVLVAADAGTVIQMNSANSTTITVNTALFSAGDSVQIQNIGAGVCTITAGTATVNTAGSLALSQWEGGFLYFTSASSAIFFDVVQSSGMTNPMTTAGDTIYGGASGTPTRLPIGSTGNVLTVSGGNPVWAAPAGGATYAVFRDEKTSGTDGGTFTSGAWRTRDLNVTQYNGIGSASLSSNQISLPAGTYLIEAAAPANRVDQHQLRVQNITDTSTSILGQNVWCYGVNLVSNMARVSGVFTIAGTKTFELQHRGATTRAGDGFGLAAGWGTEVYASITIAKVA